MNILDLISESLETIVLIKIPVIKILRCGSGIWVTLDPGWKKFGSGIRDKYLGSTTLVNTYFILISSY
jgi:hypothetical protein